MSLPKLLSKHTYVIPQKCNQPTEMVWNPQIVDHAVTSQEILTASIHTKNRWLKRDAAIQSGADESEASWAERGGNNNRLLSDVHCDASWGQPRICSRTKWTLSKCVFSPFFSHNSKFCLWLVTKQQITHFVIYYLISNKAPSHKSI